MLTKENHLWDMAFFSISFVSSMSPAKAWATKEASRDTARAIGFKGKFATPFGVVGDMYPIGLVGEACPIQEQISTSWGARSSSAKAFLIASSMGKLPQPGHHIISIGPGTSNILTSVIFIPPN